MNRPNKGDYLVRVNVDTNNSCLELDTVIYQLDSESYQKSLNEYIDYLEKQLSNLKIKNEVERQQNELLCKKVNELDKALDRACEELSCYDTSIYDGMTITKEQWKKGLLQNEQTKN